MQDGDQPSHAPGTPAALPNRGRAQRLSAATTRLLRLVAAGAVILSALLVPAGSSAADAPLSITTPYPAVSVAPGSKVSFDLTVAVAEARRVDLAVAGVPAGWTADLRGGGNIVAAVLSDPKTPQTVRLDVHVPADAAPATYHLTVTATSGAFTSSLPIDVTINQASGGDVTLTTDFPSLKGPSTTSFTFNLTLRNSTPQDLTFGVNAQGPDGWTVTARPASQSQAATFQVNAGDTAGITVTADPAADAPAGQYPITVTATAGGRTVGGPLQVEITGQYSMSLGTPDGRLNANGAAGAAIPRTLQIENTGTTPLAQVTISETLPSGWKATYDPAGPIDSIAPGQSVTVTANITPATNAIAGDYVATFRASATGASAQTTNIRVTVETPLNWLLVGGGIIVLVLVGLTTIFKRYGRR